MTVYDLTSGYNKVVGLHGSTFSNGQYSADGIDSYGLSSNGLAGTAAGADDANNFGHRGVSSATRAIRLDEIQAGAINHRLECFWWATAPSHYWPMVGHENNKGGIVPEGIVIRIKPTVNLATKGLSPAAKIVATALQQYGCIVGDNSGSGNRLKLEENVDWTGILDTDSLQPLPWSDWEFVQGGAAPQGQPVVVPNSPPPPKGGSSGGVTTSSGGTTSQTSGVSSGGTGANSSVAGSSASGAASGDDSSQGGAPNSVAQALTKGSTVQRLQNVPANLGSVVFNPSASLSARIAAGLLLCGSYALGVVLLALSALAGRWMMLRRRHLIIPSQPEKGLPEVVTPSQTGHPPMLH
jgi:hypothetical protein